MDLSQSFTSKNFIFLKILFRFKNLLHRVDLWIDVLKTQIPIFLLSVSAGALFGGAFSLWSILKGSVSGLRQFLTIENPLKMMKNTFYFMLKVFFVFEIFTILSWHLGYAEKRLDKKALVNYKICDVTDWTINNYNTHITQNPKK